MPVSRWAVRCSGPSPSTSQTSKSGPPDYDDVVPFAKRLVDTFPDRVLWGTDWPHPNMKTHMPDDGRLVDVLPRIAPTPSCA